MRLRKFIRAAALLVGMAIVGTAILYLYNEHYWPFSWASKDEAFLGTTFGMSRQEAARALAKHNARLVTYYEYRSIDGEQAFISHFDFTPLLPSDERDSYSLYMPSIEMFDATTEAEFDFDKSRLRYVYVHFLNKSKSQQVINAVTAALDKHFKLASREESKHLSGAYTLHYSSSSVTPFLWVNLTNPEKPIIELGFSRPLDTLEGQKRIKQREDAAFGH